MNQIVIVREDVMGTVLAYLAIKAANYRYIDVCDHSPIRLPIMQYLKSLSLCWRWMTKWGMECEAHYFAYKGSKSCDYL